MGQVLKTLSDYQENDNETPDPKNDEQQQGLLDLSSWPPELSLQVLSHLNATDLCLASGVWQDLALDEVLWHSLCRSNWGYTSIYKRRDNEKALSWRKLYLILDEGSITFNADPLMGMDYFFSRNIIEKNPLKIAKFFYYSKVLKRSHIRRYLQAEPTTEILDHLVRLQNFSNVNLSHALRMYLTQVIEAPTSPDDGPNDPSFLNLLISKFSRRFCECNPSLGLDDDSVYLMCYSLLMLSVDLSSPHIKNKMSKREFIKNLRKALQRIDDDLYGQLYDDVYLRGHIARQQRQTVNHL